MATLANIKPEKVFKYFEEICGIPHGSEDMNAIADYCVKFAESHSLKVIRDDADNVVIFKPATYGYEKSEPVILQGHLDMVCQKTEDCKIDFSKDGLDLFIDGDLIGAKGTTLGADNGIAVAMILAILDSNTLAHPEIQAVFTTDEEIGMIGAGRLDMNILSAKRMINLDAEEDDAITVSCAGGSDFKAVIPLDRINKSGTRVVVTLKGLQGGHSGVEIDKGRVNADILAGRFLNHVSGITDFDIISINGGDKGNAIPNLCKIELCVNNPDAFKQNAETYFEIIKQEIHERERDFDADVQICEKAEFSVLHSEIREKIIYVLLCVPNGIVEMSAEITGLVETSLNLGVLNTEDDKITLLFTLRSNKKSALRFLEEKLKTFFKIVPCEIYTSGHYPPWEFKENSKLQTLYKEVYKDIRGVEPKVEAIHAGLECGVFTSAIKGLDCIAIGPALYDVHTVNERLSISSAEMIFNALISLLERCK